MVVDDLQNIRLLQPVDGLRALVVVDQNQLLAVQVQEVTSADDAAVLTVFVQNREIAVADVRHDLFRVINRRIDAEFLQVVGAHEVPHRRGGGDETPGRVGVVGRGEDGAALFLCAGDDGAGHRRAAADDNGLCAAVDSAHLRLVPVGDEDNVAGLDEFLHDFGAGANADIAAVDAGVGRADDQLGFERLQNVRAAGVCGGQHGRVKQIHVGIGNILDRDQTLQLVLIVHNAEGVDLDIAHQVPGGAHAHFAVNARLFADVNVFDLGADISAQARRLHAEMLQNKAGLAVDMPGAARLVQAVEAAPVFQPRIRQRRADRVCIGVLVADDVDVAHCICHRWFPLYFSQQIAYNNGYYTTLFCVLRFLTNSTI